MIDRESDNPEEGRRAERESALERALQAKADIMLGSVRLASALESDRAPDSLESTFIFIPSDIPSAQLPSQIVDVVGHEYDSLQVTFEGQHAGNRAAYSVLITKGLDQPEQDHDQDVIIQFGRQMHESTGPTYAHISNGEEDSKVLCCLSEQDVNRFFASLIFPSLEGDWRFFDNVDPQDPKTAANIAEALEKVCPATVTKRHYLLSGSDGGVAGELDVIDENGMPAEVTVSRRLINDVTITPDFNLAYRERSIAAQIQTYGRTSIEFLILDTQTKEVRQGVNPDQGELDAMREFVDYEQIRLEPEQPQLMGDKSFEIADPLAERDDRFTEEDLD